MGKLLWHLRGVVGKANLNQDTSPQGYSLG
jgi:hypothetical protein